MNFLLMVLGAALFAWCAMLGLQNFWAGDVTMATVMAAAAAVNVVVVIANAIMMAR